MAKDKEKTQNIITIIIVVIALILAAAVVLVKTGVLTKNGETEDTEEETVVESRIVVETTVNDEGEVEYVTVLEYYTAPAQGKQHRYSTTTTKPTKATEPEETEPETSIVEHSKVLAVTNADGQVLYDDSGEIQTEIVTYTEVVTTAPSTSETTTESTTEYVPEYSYSVVTDPVFKKPKKDKDGNTVTEAIILNPTTTEPTTEDRWSENVTDDTTTTKKKIITTNYSAQENLENAILAQINDDREIKGLPAISSSKDLKTAARTNSLSMIDSNINAQTGYGKTYTFTSSYAGTSLYNVIATSGAGTTSMSEDITSVGIGVYKSGEKYYTTLIFQ